MTDLESSETTTTPQPGPGLEGSSDADLIRLVRSGDSEAYEHLFLRHRDVAIRYARRISSSERAEDLCAEAFAKILDLLQRGKGPDVAFRAYLLTTVRTSHLNALRTGTREHLVPDHESVWTQAPTIEDPDARFDHQAVCRAFSQLPERWQAALWLTTVEGLPYEQVGLHLGISTNAVASLAFRARTGLRQAYLAEHLLGTTDPQCRRVLDQLPGHARGTLTGRRSREVEEHLSRCSRCTRAALELAEVETQLGALIAPLALTGFAAAAVVVPTNAVPLAALAVSAAKGLVAGVATVTAATKSLLLGAAGQTKALAATAPGLIGSKTAVTASVTAIGLAAGAEVVTQYEAPPSPPRHSAPAPGWTQGPDGPPLPRTSARRGDPGRATPPRQPIGSRGLPFVAPTTPTGPAAPGPTASAGSSGTSPAEPQTAARSMAVGEPTHEEDTSSGSRWEEVSIPVANPVPGAVLVVTTTRTLHTTRPGTDGTGWTCGIPSLRWLDLDFLPTSRFVCRYDDPTPSTTVPLRFSYQVGERSLLTAVLTPPPGHDDASAEDNTRSLVLRP